MPSTWQRASFRHDDLVRVLPETVTLRLSYWVVVRAETLRRPVVAVVVEAIRDRMADQHDVLLGIGAS